LHIKGIRNYIKLARTNQWIKNLFTVLPAIFITDKLNIEDYLRLIATFSAFCLLSSSIYAVNDILDREQDARHPKKSSRPIASGSIRTRPAVIFSIALLCAALLATRWANGYVTVTGCAYYCLNLAYSFYAKHVPLIDVFFIASGFIMRVYAGGAAVGAPISPWLMLNTLFLSLFLGFGKRWSEMTSLAGEPGRRRVVLGEYSPETLNFFLISSCAMTMVCYALYTIDSNTVKNIGSIDLVYTVPVAAYGLFRYVLILFRSKEDLDVAEVFISDKPLILASLIWLSLIFLIIAHNRVAKPI
jgi:4-hydroxybenzoate polyprenyltransferase